MKCCFLNSRLAWVLHLGSEKTARSIVRHCVCLCVSHGIHSFIQLIQAHSLFLSCLHTHTHTNSQTPHTMKTHSHTSQINSHFLSHRKQTCIALALPPCAGNVGACVCSWEPTAKPANKSVCSLLTEPSAGSALSHCLYLTVSAGSCFGPENYTGACLILSVSARAQIFIHRFRTFLSVHKQTHCSSPRLSTINWTQVYLSFWETKQHFYHHWLQDRKKYIFLHLLYVMFSTMKERTQLH